MNNSAQKIVLEKDQHISRLQAEIRIDKQQLYLENLGQQIIKVYSSNLDCQLQKGENQTFEFQNIKLIFGNGDYQIELLLDQPNPLLINSPVFQKQYVDESQILATTPKILLNSKVSSLIPKVSNSSTTEQNTVLESNKIQNNQHPLAECHNQMYESPSEQRNQSDISLNDGQIILQNQEEKQKSKLQQKSSLQEDDIQDSDEENLQMDNIQVIDDDKFSQNQYTFKDLNQQQQKSILTIQSSDFHNKNPQIIIPKIIKKYQYNFEIMSQELDITNKSVFISSDVTQQQKNILKQFNCTIVNNISKINEVVCMFTPHISRSSRLLVSLITGIPIFNSVSLMYASTVKASKQPNTPYKLTFIRPTIQEIRQLFKDDINFNIQEFDLPSLSKHYCQSRLLCSVKNIIVTASSLQLDLDNCESDCNSFAFLFYLTQLGMQVHFIYDQKYDYKVTSVLQQSNNNKNIKCHRDISGSEDQRLKLFIEKKVKNKQDYLFMVTDWYIFNQKDTYQIQTINKLNLIEAAFINDIIC